MTASPATELAYFATINRLTLALLRGTLEGEKLLRSKPDGGEWARTWMGRMAGRRGDVVVHLRGGEGGGPSEPPTPSTPASRASPVAAVEPVSRAA